MTDRGIMRVKKKILAIFTISGVSGAKQPCKGASMPQTNGARIAGNGRTQPEDDAADPVENGILVAQGQTSASRIPWR